MKARLLLPMLLLASPVLAQEPPIDPRLVGPAVAMLQAESAYRGALVRALVQDQEKRERELAEWFKAWFAAPEKEAK